MKKKLAIFGIISLFTVSFAYDGSAGPSLNRGDTVGEYNRLMKVSEDALNSGDNKEIDKAIDGIEDFLDTVDEYRGVSSPGASKYLNKFEKDLEAKLKELKK